MNKNCAMNVINEQTVLGKSFKMYGTIDEPLFLAKDVAEWIEHSNVSMMLKVLNEDEVTKQCLGGLEGTVNMLTEDGLYEVLMQSRKPIAKEFKKQVKIMLKSIRTNGGYITGATEEETKSIVQTFKASKYLTDDIHDRKSIRKFIREYDLMRLDECIDIIAEMTNKIKGDIKHDLLDVAINELKAIDSNLMKDTIKNTYVKDTAVAGIVVLQDVKIGKYKRRVKKLEQVG